MSWLILLGDALSVTLTVGATGADHSTIGAAIEAASDGDVLEIGPGLYVECLDPGGKDLELRGSGVGATVIQGDGSCESALLIDDGESATISQLSIMNTTGRAVEVVRSSLLLDGARGAPAEDRDDDRDGLVDDDDDSLDLASTTVCAGPRPHPKSDICWPDLRIPRGRRAA